MLRRLQPIRRIRVAIIIIGIFSTVAAGLPQFNAGIAHALSNTSNCYSSPVVQNRNYCYGYFSNTNYYNGTLSVGDVIQGNNALGQSAMQGISNLAEFQTVISSFLNGGGANAAGAAFIVEVMLSKSYPSTGVSLATGVANAKNDLPTLVARLQNYQNAGLINWTQPLAISAPFQDSARSGGEPIFYYKQADEPTSNYIVINDPSNPSKALFRLRKNCGNFIGSIEPIKCITGCTPGLPGHAHVLKFDLNYTFTAETTAAQVCASSASPGCYNGLDSQDWTNLSLGSHTFTAALISGTYRLVGYRACDSPCDPTAQPLVAASSFTNNFASDDRINLIWYYRPPIAGSFCPSAPNVDNPEAADGDYKGNVTFVNTGETIWTPADTVLANASTIPSAWQYNGVTIDNVGLVPGSPQTTNLGSPWFVSPGQSVTFSLQFQAPFPPDQYDYNFAWQIKQNGALVSSACGTTVHVERLFNYVPDIYTVGPTWESGTPVNLNASVTNINPGTTKNGVPYTTDTRYCIGTQTLMCDPASGASFGQGWSNGGLGPNASDGIHPVTFPFLPFVQDGTYICFGLVVAPGTNSNPALPYPDSPQNSTLATANCHQIANPNFPYLTTSNGDVHAGGNIVGASGLCNATSGSITGNAGAFPKSQASYVVSAYGDISQFGSNNTAGGSGLTFRNNSLPYGGYGTVCRADLVTQAKNTPLANTLTGLDVNANNPGQDLVVPVGPGGTITGKTIGVNNRWTLFVNGDVIIAGNIVYAVGSAYSRDSLPSFGMIVDGNIYINHSVTKLDGFYYASKGINTCSDILTVGMAKCNLPLTVNGLLSAHSFRFLRNNIDQIGGQYDAREIVNFLSQLYLALPPAFDNESNLPQFQGEKPPLY